MSNPFDIKGKDAEILAEIIKKGLQGEKGAESQNQKQSFIQEQDPKNQQSKSNNEEILGLAKKPQETKEIKPLEDKIKNEDQQIEIEKLKEEELEKVRIAQELKKKELEEQEREAEKQKERDDLEKAKKAHEATDEFDQELAEKKSKEKEKTRQNQESLERDEKPTNLPDAKKDQQQGQSH